MCKRRRQKASWGTSWLSRELWKTVLTFVSPVDLVPEQNDGRRLIFKPEDSRVQVFDFIELRRRLLIVHDERSIGLL